MSKLSLNLMKISENQPKFAVERIFLEQNIRLMKQAGEEKRMDFNNIHLCPQVISYLNIHRV